MDLEVLNKMIETATSVSMNVANEMVQNSTHDSTYGFVGLAIAVVASVVIANWIWDKILGK